MTPERWQRVSDVYEAVLERPAHERGEFLSVACGGDDSLLEDVQSLLSQDDRESPLDRSVWAPEDLLASAHAGLEPGSRLGPYLIQAKLGSGGMGEVYRGIDTRLDRPVAIKILKPEVAADDQFRGRFDREARTISSLDHPNICTLYDVGNEGATAFLVMQYLDGAPLSDRIRRGPVPAAEVIDIAISLASALTYAHGRGILHRDIKPQNVIVLPDGRVKLLDFGIAKPHGVGPADTTADTSEALTVLGQTLGTLEYMSPETLSGGQIDGRADMFSLGLVLHQLCTGRHPFKGETSMLTVSAILWQDYAGLPDGSGATAGLDRVLRRMLSKEAAGRYPTMADCLVDLQRLEQGTGPVERSADSAPAVWSRPRLAGAVALGAAAMLVLLFALTRGDQRPADETSRAASEGTAAPVVSPVTSVSYWLDVEPPAALGAETPGFRSIGDEVYGNGWRFRLNLQAEAPGHAYLVADEPPSTPTQTGLALLFVSAAGSTGDTSVTTDWFVFTGPPTREDMWLVWSSTPVEELAGLATLLNPTDRGLVSDAESAQRVRTLLTGDAVRATNLSLDRDNLRATLTSGEPMVVHRLELQHD